MALLRITDNYLKRNSEHTTRHTPFHDAANHAAEQHIDRQRNTEMSEGRAQRPDPLVFTNGPTTPTPFGPEPHRLHGTPAPAVPPRCRARALVAGVASRAAIAGIHERPNDPASPHSFDALAGRAGRRCEDWRAAARRPGGREAWAGPAPTSVQRLGIYFDPMSCSYLTRSLACSYLMA